jgi:hypothetical protein
VKFLLLIVSLGLMTPALAQAQTSRFSTATLCEIVVPCQPPAEYASGAFLAKAVVRHVPLRQIQIICGGGYAAFLGEKAKQRPLSLQAAIASGQAADFGILGCADLNATTCVVHVPSDVKLALPELFRLVLAHELAHCRGWVHRRY